MCIDSVGIFFMEVTSNFNNVSTPKKSKTTLKDRAVYAGGTIAALVGSSAIQSSSIIPASGVLATISKIEKYPKDTIDLIHKASENALEVSGLKDKGLSIEWLKSSGKKLNLIDKFKLIINQSRGREAIEEGINACFSPITNKIYMPEKKLSFAAFHEIGHAINYNNSKFWNKMQKMGTPAMALAMLPLLYGAISRESKAEDGKDLNKRQKANNFIRNNAGKLSFAAMLPMLAEEGMASIRGQKLANKLLPKNVAKTVLKGNAVAYTSYLISALGFAAASYTAVKIKDAIVNKRQASKQQV